MKIAIDLNDVIRAYTAQFASYYKRNIDRTIDIDELDVWTNDLSQVFKFESRQKFLEFVYNDYPFEIYGCAENMDKNMSSRFSDWCKELLDLEKIPEVCIVSTGEYDKTIGSTHLYLSKLATKIRETYLMLDENDIWDKCDVLITANPNLLLLKPEGKLTVKIDAPYNTEIESDYAFDSFMDFMNDEEILNKLIN